MPPTPPHYNSKNGTCNSSPALVHNDANANDNNNGSSGCNGTAAVIAASSSFPSIKTNGGISIVQKKNGPTGKESDDDETLVQMFKRVSQNHFLRKRIVLEDLHRTWTLGQLDEITDKLAKFFIAQFACKLGTSIIAIYMNKCAEYVLAYIAALKAGAAYLPLDISYPQSLLKSVLDEVNPVVVCTSECHVANLPDGTRAFVMDSDDCWLDKLAAEGNDTDEGITLPTGDQLTATNLAYVVYSSGTTGKPKGIRCPHRGAVISYKWRFKHFPYIDDDVEACNVFFVWEMFRPILQAARMVIIPDTVIYDPALLCEFLADNRVTRMLFTPSLLEMLLDTQEDPTLARAFRHMRIVHLCGEVVTCTLLDRFFHHFPHVRCINLYSISETHDVAVADLNEFHSRGEKRQFAPVGKVIQGVKVLILDGKTMKRVPIGVPGEIYISGPTLAYGYINRPELNRDRFIPIAEEYQAECGDAKQMYKTGDWGYMLPNAMLEICGRCDTTVRIRGYSVELQAIEAALRNLASVGSCAVVSIGTEGENKQLAAYIVLRDKSVTRKQLRAQLKQSLPFYMMPQFFIFVNRLPVLAASSKIDRNALPPVVYTRDVIEVEAQPQTQTERQLANVWSKLLHLDGNLDIQESFFDMGGHSLLAARLLQKINKSFGSSLTIRDLFAAPTVYGMGRLLDGLEMVSTAEQGIDLEQQVEAHDVKNNNILDLHLRAFWRATTEWKKRFSAASILLTGATGFLGSHLLAELLYSSKTKIVCLVRESLLYTAKEDERSSAERRLLGVLRKNELLTNALAQQFRERVRVMAGDIALVHFGLSDEDYHFLTYDVDVVLHAAAYANLIYPYQALHGCNVIGTRNVIDFCLDNKLKPMHYISTDAVFPSGLNDVDENHSSPKAFCKQLTDGYGQSKYVAEQLVLRARDRGLPAVVYRLGNQAAATNSGAWNEQDFTYLMLLATLRTGAAPRMEEDWQVELTPVDFTARFIVRVLSESFCENAGKIFHLIDTKNAVRWSQLINCLRAFGLKLEPVEFGEWMQIIENGTATDEHLLKLQKLLHGLLHADEKLEFAQSNFLRSNTNELLNAIGWEYPSLSETRLIVWIRRLVEKGIVLINNGNAAGTTMLHESSKMLTGLTCIVTGASEGIGESITRAIAIQTEANVVLAARQMHKLDWIVQNLHGLGVPRDRLMAVQCDVTAASEVDALVRQTIAHFGKIDMLINSAGQMYYSMAKNGYTDEWRKQIDVNVHGTTLMIGAVLPHMVGRRQGHVLTITSDAGKRAFPGLAVYSGTKFYQEGFTNALRQECAEFGVKFTNIQPGDVATALASRSSDNEARKKYDFSGAGHKILDPDDVAKSVIFAISQPQHVAINELLIQPQAMPT